MIEVRRLPLWKNCLDSMRKIGIEYGSVFTADFFEAELSVPIKSIRFGVDVSRIRRELEREGFFLSGQGHNGQAFEIIPASQNHEVMGQYLRKSKDLTTRAVILGTNTNVGLLTESQKVRHAQKLERAQMRQALIAKERPIFRLIQKTAPSLIRAIQSSERDGE